MRFNKQSEIDIKNRKYCFFNDINIKNFAPNNIKIEEKSHKNVIIYLYWMYDEQRFETCKN